MASSEKLMQVIHIQTEIAKLGLDLGGVMQFVVDQTLSLVEAEGAAIELAEDGEMVYRAASGVAAPQLGLRLKIEGSLSGLSVMTGETMFCEDSETDPRVDRLACQKMGLRSMLVMPLKHRGITVGVLKSMSAEPDKFKGSDVVVLELLSEVVAAAMYFSAKYDKDELFKKATHDDMTGLANRALFMDRLRNTIAHTKRKSVSAGLLMIDMDSLKQINDTYGHRIGDAVIIEFSNRLKKVVRAADTAARLGGDEFGVVLAPIENWDEINCAIKRIESGIELPFIFENKQHQLRASIGSALIPHDGIDPEKVMEVADNRMYAIKGKSKVLPA